MSTQFFHKCNRGIVLLDLWDNAGFAYQCEENLECYYTYDFERSRGPWLPISSIKYGIARGSVQCRDWRIFNLLFRAHFEYLLLFDSAPILAISETRSKRSLSILWFWMISIRLYGVHDQTCKQTSKGACTYNPLSASNPNALRSPRIRSNDSGVRS